MEKNNNSVQLVRPITRDRIIAWLGMETNASTSGRQGWFATRVCETDGETMISRETNGGRKTAAVKRPPSIINPCAIRLSINSLGVLPISAPRNNKKTVIYESAARKRWRRSRLASFVRLILPFRAAAFIGYVLPWWWNILLEEQRLLQIYYQLAIPYIGNTVVLWIWGGINNAKFFKSILFYSFYLTSSNFIYLFALHLTGSSNRLSNYNDNYKISFPSIFFN